MKQTHGQNEEWSGMTQSPDTGRGQRCDRAAEWEPLLYDFAEGLTDEKTGAAVKEHLAGCTYCRGALEDIRWMRTALRESVPEPKTDLTARVMKTIRAEEESGGRVVTETLDARTGRVITSRGGKHSLHRIVRAVSCIAAAVLVVLGLLYVLPLLRMGGGTASGTQDILGEMQSGEDARFSDGVFVGSTPQTEQRTILLVSGTTESALAALLSQLTAAEDGTAITVTETDDGYLLTPLSALSQVSAILESAGLRVTLDGAAAAAASDDGDAFYVRILEP